MCKKSICLAWLVVVLGLVGSASAGLAGHWSLDEGTGTAVQDSSDNRNHGTLMGDPQWVTGYFSNALEFDGVDDYVEVPHDASLTVSTGVTVAAWINAERHTGPGGAGWQGIVAKGNTSRSYSLYTESGGGLHFSTAGVGTVSTADVPLNEWVHVVAMVEAGEHKYYMNGEPAGQGGGGITLPGTADVESVLIGDTHEDSREFLGMIDEVYIYDRPLTEAQIVDLVNGIGAQWLKAQFPDPADGATGVTTPLLQWTPGETALSHDVYFGTSPTLGPDEYMGPQGWTVYWHTPGITAGVTYYWRVDEVEADGNIITGDVWSFTAAPLAAFDPSPADGAKHVPTDVQLTWSPGSTAISHDVYFGTDETEVADGTGDTSKGNMPMANYTPVGLVKETTYYWRVDEKDKDGKIYPGEVWSFTTVLDIPIGDPNLVGWWKLDTGSGTTVLDWSGYDNYGTLNGGPEWVPGYDGDALDFDGFDDYVDVPHNEVLTVDTEVTVMAWIKAARHNSAGGDWQAILAKSNNPRSYSFYTHVSGTLHFSTTSAGAYVGSNSSGQVPLNEWAHVCAMVIGGAHQYYINGLPAGTGGGGIVLPGAADTAPVRIGVSQEGGNNFLGMIDDARVYRTALTMEEVQDAMRGDTTVAWSPDPANGATADIEKASVLTWKAGEIAVQHDVYFGTDRDAVADADASDTTGVYRGRQGATSYVVPAALEWGGRYFWRIDEQNSDGTVSPGRLWSFTVADYLIVDDFEDYNDYSDRIFYYWLDGWGYTEPAPGKTGNGTGSTVGYLQAPFAEQTIVHSGLQSMPLEYDNTGATGKARYSETEYEWPTAQDLTRQGVKALALYVYGDPCNVPASLYVGLQDSAGTRIDVPETDTNLVQMTGWQEINIELSRFAPVSLVSVKKIFIGVGNRLSPTIGGTGMLYIDDIRLYRPRCVASLLKPANDLNDDCVVDYLDLEIVANEWLGTGYLVTPVDPGTSGLVAYYPLDGNTNDTVGGYNGTPNGGPGYMAGQVGQALRLDGADDYVVVTSVGISGGDARTIACWAKANSAGIADWTNIFGFTGPASNGQHFDFQIVGDTDSTTQGWFGLHMHGDEYDILPNDLDWHHLAATFDGTTQAFYGDGRLVGTAQYSISPPGNVHMGKREDNDNYFPGLVDEARIFNRALSADEVAYLGGLTLPYSAAFDLNVDDAIDFLDVAVLGDAWLDEALWPAAP
ncbi:MAG: LamG domain-containing protein [Phycisphaerales bacterium]|nr:MAG: LamG domain-containing protein [Phycisphaerales bacterium]